jgi:thiol-disulfide isomerase/thioredoxin
VKAFFSIVLAATLLFSASHSLAAGSEKSFTPRKAPAFTLANVDGEQIEFPRRAAEGVDIYFFWATWCPYCKALMPHLQSMLDEYGSDVRVYAMNIREDGDPKAYLESQGYNFMLMPDADAVAKMYNAMSTPGVFVVDSNGMVRMSLYELLGQKEPGYDKLSNRQKAARRGPWWGAQIRQAVDQVLNPGRREFARR